MRITFALLAALMLIFTTIAGAANWALYHPIQYPDGLWDVQSKIGAEDRWIHAVDGVKLHAWWLARKDAPFVTLFLHGNAGNITYRTGHAVAITKAGSSVLLLDYRGYGKSEGRPSERGLYADAMAAYQSLRDAGYRPDRIIIHGESLGTAVAVELATQEPCAGVILEAPLESVRKVAGSIVPVLGPLVVAGYDTRSKVHRLRSPLLVIHGDKDHLVPYSHGVAVFNAAPEPKAFWRVPGAHHHDILEYSSDSYPQRLREFYATLR